MHANQVTSEVNENLLSGAETEWVRERALAAGFDACGIAPVERFSELAKYPTWLERGYAGEMDYLKDARRMDPASPLPGARSLIACALNYNADLPYSIEIQGATSGAARGWISRYAWGDDYHEVIRQKLNTLSGEMRDHFGEAVEFRSYADTGPVHERLAAKYAGLGWIGKHTLLIDQKLGSWFFLGVILTSLPLLPTLGAAELPAPDRCGSCTRCIDACPTHAIVEPYVLDASRCISYLTIEKRGAIPDEFREPIGAHVFGCDICQDVCPWNRRSPRTSLKAFHPRDIAGESNLPESLYAPDLLRVLEMSEEQFKSNFRRSPIKRTKWKGLIRNACIALGNAGLPADLGHFDKAKRILGMHAASLDTGISESARWALARIEEKWQAAAANRQPMAG
jgi:epoxyqueuosine reductase